uniref:Cytochrome P450 monooxygenase esdpG n=1 Tax=Penicillium shearii TaxID=904690 RepID=ESDPG_PENSH|nr:cytochrome P450 oxidase [Penicillium shearii]
MAFYSAVEAVLGVTWLSALFTLGSLSVFWLLRHRERKSQHALHNAWAQISAFDPSSLDRSKTADDWKTTRLGKATLVSNRYAHEIRNDERLSFQLGLEQDFLTTVPGLESLFGGTFHNGIVWDAAMHFSRKLNTVVDPLSEETIEYLQKNWGDDKEWHTVPLHHSMLMLIAQLTARLFIGEELCRDPEWLGIATGYTMDRTFAVKELQQWNPRLIPVVHWFLPSCRKLRATIKKARGFVDRVRTERKQKKTTADDTNRVDAMTWIDSVARDQNCSYDATLTQLRLAYAAVHTTGDMMTKVVAALCENPEMIEPLRKEIISIISEHGWREAALHKMTLLDSVLKESQRIQPLGLYTLSRIALEPITLDDGTQIKKGEQVKISTDHMWNSSIWPDAAQFDGYRFQRFRDNPDQSSAVSFVSLSANHMGFGYGKHACPGRFLAAIEAKVALCHLLLKYDFELENKEASAAQTEGVMIWRDHRAQLRIKRRVEKIEW